MDRDAVAEEVWEERRRPGEPLGHTSDSRETLDGELQRDSGELRSKPALRLGDHRGGKVSESIFNELMVKTCFSYLLD